jgi:hypothetical protein
MQERLRQANKDVLHQIEIVQDLIGAVSNAGELMPYITQISGRLDALRRDAQRNIRDLDYELPETIPDVLSATQSLTTEFEVINSLYVAPITRGNKEDDKLALSLMRWLHDSHPSTRPLAFALSNGSFAIRATAQVPPIYLLPVSRQHSLLYLSLLFHEFGHLLYSCHRPEMDDLVREFLIAVSNHVAPQVIRDPSTSGRDDEFRVRLLDRWYLWAQEIFCDAVGLCIGGPSFLKALSHFLCTRSPEQYYVPRERQLQQGHPVTWIRIKMLVDLARKFGYTALADQIERAWSETATALRIREDYGGTWYDEFFMPLRNVVDDMLEEAQPLQTNRAAVNPSSHEDYDDPIWLLNLAWHVFETDSKTYKSWEREAIRKYLQHR